MPSDVFVGVRCDDMFREGIACAPLGGNGYRGQRQRVEILIQHRFLPLGLLFLSPYGILLCLNQFKHDF